MKARNLVAALAATLMIPTVVLATDTSGEATAAPEWHAFAESLAPIADGLVPRLSDPQDPQLKQELYRFLVSQLAGGYMGLLYEDINHPDFWPMFNLAFNQAFPNPDDTYYVAPLEGNGVYRISGFRGSVHIANFSVASGQLVPQGNGPFGMVLANYELEKLHLKKDGSFEVLLSNERPADYKGDWWKLDPKATYIMMRQISYDWVHETDGRYAIERLDRPAAKPRPSAQHIDANMKKLHVWAEYWTAYSMDWVQRLRERGTVNQVKVNNFNSVGGVSTQRYIEGLFNLQPDEALVLETVVPKCRYWGFQLSDELWASMDWVNRQTSINGYTAKIDKDGKFRVVISAQDPGVANWLDTIGYQKGIIYGRWENCDDTPTPTVTKVKVADVRKYLPANTPAFSAEERDASVRLRRKAVQLRRRW